MKKRSVLWLSAGVLAVPGLACLLVFTVMRFSGLLLLALAAAVALYAALDRLGENRRWAVTLRRGMLVLIAVGALVFAGLEAWIVSDAHTDAETETGCVIVLGAGVNGTEPSLAMKLRLNAALRYIESRPDIPLIVTGSRGAGEDVSEAEAMRRYLVDRGVPESRILMEEQAGTTAENLRYSKVIMEDSGVDMTLPAALVTNDFHLCRARLLASQQGLDTVGVACRFPYAALQINYYAREAFGLVKALLLKT